MRIFIVLYYRNKMVKKKFLFKNKIIIMKLMYLKKQNL